MSFYFTLEPPAGHPLHADKHWYVDDRDGWTVAQVAADAADDYGVESCCLKRAGVMLTGTDLASEAITEGETLTLEEA